jgi:hypothetical protein
LFPTGLGGFAHDTVFDSRFCYKIPDGLEPKYAGPLMCAGATVFTALTNYDVKPTDHIGIVGIGGLGHLGLQFARAWGCHVVAISTNTVSHLKQPFLRERNFDIEANVSFNLSPRRTRPNLLELMNSGTAKNFRQNTLLHLPNWTSSSTLSVVIWLGTNTCRFSSPMELSLMLEFQRSHYLSMEAPLLSIS